MAEMQTVAQPQTTTLTETNSQNSAPVTSEVKEAAAQTPTVETVNQEGQVPAKADVATDSQATKPEAETISQAAMFEIEETLKELDPNDVLKFQRELSAERGQNLFIGKIGELFNKYKPKATERSDKVKSLAAMLKQADKPALAPTTQQTVKGNEPNLNTELLQAKVELELVKNGVPQEFLEEATIVAMSKVKSLGELSKASEVANKFAVLKTSSAPAVPSRTSVGIGENRQDMTEAEKTVAYLRNKNPNGWKKN